MQKRLICSCVLLPLAATIGCAAAQRAPKPQSTLPHLSKLSVELRFVDGSIHYNPAISVVLMQKIDESDRSPGDQALRAIQTKINAQDSDIYVIDFDPGPSVDPAFIVHRKEGQTLVRVGVLSGTELRIPGDGSILVSGIIDDFFDRERKYVLKGQMITEVIQPFYYVGITTTNTRPLFLYADTSSEDIVEHLPTGSVVEVLVARANYKEGIGEEGVRYRTLSGYDFLAKSPNGLLGWVRSGGLCGEETIKGICFHGD